MRRPTGPSGSCRTTWRPLASWRPRNTRARRSGRRPVPRISTTTVARRRAVRGARLVRTASGAAATGGADGDRGAGRGSVAAGTGGVVAGAEGRGRAAGDGEAAASTRGDTTPAGRG